MKATITNVCFLVAAYLFVPAGTVRGANVQAVGYANVSINQRPQLIANQLSHMANRIDQVMAWAPEGTKLVTFDGRNWLTNEYLPGPWTYPESALSPGQGALLFSPTNWLWTYTGEYLQGELKVWIPAGGSLRSSLVPQSGKLSEQLQFPKVAGTKIYNVDNSGQLVLLATCSAAGWEPEEPTLAAAESFYVEAPHEFVWSRAFALFDGDSPFATAIRILNQPQNQQISPGDTLSLAVEASGSFEYQWQLNGEDIPNATEPTLVIPQAGSEHFGKYWVKIWDDRSWVWSDIAVVQAASPPAPRLTIEQDHQGRGLVLVSEETSGRRQAIEVSTDLIQWTDLKGAEPIDAQSVLDRWTTQAARFYRLRLD